MAVNLSYCNQENYLSQLKQKKTFLDPNSLKKLHIQHNNKNTKQNTGSNTSNRRETKHSQETLEINKNEAKIKELQSTTNDCNLYKLFRKNLNIHHQDIG